MPLKSLYFTNVGPFDDIEFEFDPQVNVFTGPNNSGKSSALWVLGEILTYPFSLPVKLLRSENAAKFEAHISENPDEKIPGRLPIGIAGISERHPAFDRPDFDRIAEEIRVMAMREKLGYSKFIPALRQSSDFRSKGPTVSPAEDSDGGIILLSPEFDAERLRDVQADLKKRRGLFPNNAYLVSDKAVVQKIIDLDYRAFLRKERRFGDIIAKIGEVASDITDGYPVKFDGVDEDDGGFFPKFSTVDGPLPLNTLSQGTQSIIQWLAHLLIGYAEYYDFPESLADKPGILIVDEIDAHLHPSWQRRVIPALTRHFPSLQIFCSTHSPLMLAGLKEGQVQLLHTGRKREGHGIEKRGGHSRLVGGRNPAQLPGRAATPPT